eukprot:SAG11_NODE_9166_length_936_cov_1.008363_2_plen_82_part_01
MLIDPKRRTIGPLGDSSDIATGTTRSSCGSSSGTATSIGLKFNRNGSLSLARAAGDLNSRINCFPVYRLLPPTTSPTVDLDL